MAHSTFKTETVIRTERLRIRPIVQDDAQFIWDVRVHRKIYQWTMAGQWLDRKVADEWTKTALDTANNYNFIVELPCSTHATTATTDPPALIKIGSIGLFGEDSELGYLIHPEYWGQGYATEMVSAFIKALWVGVPDVEKVRACVDSENGGSLRVLEKCEFREVRRGEYENKTLGVREEVVFEIVRPLAAGVGGSAGA